MLGPKLLFAGIVGAVGSCIYSIAMPVSFAFQPISFWTMGENDVFPLFTCRGEQSRFQLSLAFKKESGSNRKEKLYLKGWDFKSNIELDWEEIVGVSDKKWQLQVFDKGVTRLETLSGAQFADNYGTENIVCDANKLIVTKPSFDGSTSWSSSVAKIKFDTDGCNDDLKNKGCSIKIAEGVGLKWNPELEKQLTFSN